MPVHCCRIATARIGYKAQHNEHVCDVTVKCAQGFLRTFAPTWELVMASKHHRITWAQYTEQYQALMRQRFTMHEYHFKELLYRDEIVLCCYCEDSSRHVQRCHRYLLRDILLKVGRRYGIDAIAVGEYHNPKPPRRGRKR
jgi:uncharacterized protein YeaO (DUF488 family)